MRRASTMVVCGALFLPAALAAQSWNLDFQVGRMRSALDPATPATENGALGLRFERGQTAFRLSTGGPVSLERPRWGAVAFWQRFALHHSGLLAGLDVSGNGLLLQTGERQVGVPGLLDPPGETTSPGGHAFAGQALPLVGYESERFRAQARAGISYYNGEFAGESRSRTVRLADAQLWFQPHRALALVPTVRHFVFGGEHSTFASLTAAVSPGRIGVWGTVGEWLTAPSGTPISWAAGGTFEVPRLFTVNASVRRDPFDPLYLTPAQTAWSAGISIPLGKPREIARAPVPARYRSGVATIRLPTGSVPRAEKLSIAGDFNGWKATPMERRDDAWVFTIAVSPGIYHYAFVDANGKWFVPENVPGRRDDGMGGYVAVLVVERDR